MGIITWQDLSYHMRWKGALTRLRARHDCQSSLKLAQEQLIGSSTRNLLTAHWETYHLWQKWLARLCFVTVTPFYEPITEVVLLTWYSRVCNKNTSSFNAHTECFYMWELDTLHYINPLYTNDFFLLVWYNKLGLVHCTYLGVSGYNFQKILYSNLFTRTKVKQR